MTRLIAFNKPFNVLSQFTDKGTLASTRETLSDYLAVPRVYPAGRDSTHPSAATDRTSELGS